MVKVSVSDWRTFPDMRLIYGWHVTTSWVRRPLWVNQLGQLSLLPSVGRGMSSISVAGWMKLLAVVSPSNECLCQGKADVVYLQVTVWSTSERFVVELLTIGAMQVPLPFLYIHATNTLCASVYSVWVANRVKECFQKHQEWNRQMRKRTATYQDDVHNRMAVHRFGRCQLSCCCTCWKDCNSEICSTCAR